MNPASEKFFHPEIVNITNPDILNNLNKIKDSILQAEIKGEPSLGEPYDETNCLSDKFCDDLVAQGSKHSGYPPPGTEWVYSVLQETNTIRMSNETYEFFHESHIELQYQITCNHQALIGYYPPQGFIGWHNNANAGGYVVLFTWSETGEGHFLYRDENNKTVKVPDKPGWCAKMLYFPHHHETEKQKFYHAAYTDCRRISLGFRFLDEAALWREAREAIMYE